MECTVFKNSKATASLIEGRCFFDGALTHEDETTLAPFPAVWLIGRDHGDRHTAPPPSQILSSQQITLAVRRGELIGTFSLAWVSILEGLPEAIQTWGKAQRVAPPWATLSLALVVYVQCCLLFADKVSTTGEASLIVQRKERFS